MNPMPDLSGLLARARDKGIFGTKMRSVIHGADPVGIESVVAQQFSVAREILGSGLVPIIEPEIDITIADKPQAEAILLRALLSELSSIDPAAPVMLKLSLPDTDDLYQELTNHPSVLRVVALSGGYPREEANGRLAKNHGVIASFSRALTEGLSIEQTDEEFTLTLDAAIGAIFDASNT
jgi:fructose-bisphosphate aldolase class I